MVINRRKDLCQHALKIKNLEKRYYQKIDIAIEPNTDNTQTTALSHKKDKFKGKHINASRMDQKII